MLCVLQYSCLDEAVPRQQLYQHSLQVGEISLQLADCFQRQTQAYIGQVAWLKKQWEKDKTAIEQWKLECEKLQQEAMAARCGKFSYCVSRQYKYTESECGKNSNSSSNTMVIVSICRPN